MSAFSRILSSGDLRSDGFADEVARIVSEHPDLLPDLVGALAASDPAVRGHAADALEKVSRSYPNEVAAFLPSILRAAQNDPVAMVRWHMAMTLGHLSSLAPVRPEAEQVLLALLKDESTFVKTWAITSLCILAKTDPDRCEAIIQKIAPLAGDPSVAVAKRAQMALRALADPASPLPKGWVKNQ